MEQRSYSEENEESGEEDNNFQDMMLPMMMTMMNTGRKANAEGGGSAPLMEQLKKQNELIMALNTGQNGGNSKDTENTALMNRLNELEEKLATKLNKTSQGGGGMDALFSEDMMSMLMLNMQSSIQMLPLLQQRQMQQKQNSMQFQTYISQMQALNSMLHTLSYGTPLSELNKLHSGVKNQFESYNNEVSGRLKGVINQVKDMNKATELEKERLLHQLNDEEMRSEDEDEEFKDELDKLEERVEAQHRAKATTNQAVSVGAAPELSASSRQKTNLPLQQAGAMSQMPFYSQQQQPAYNPYAQSMAYPQMPGLNPYMASQVYPPYGYELKYDSSKSSSSRRDARQEKKPKKARDNSSSESKKKKKKTKKADYESDSKVSALDSPREVGSKEKKTKPDPMSMLFPSMPNMENMDPMMKNMMLMNMLSTMNQGESKKKKKRKGHKRDREEDSEEKPQVFYHPSNLAFPNMDQMMQGSAANPSRRKPGDKAQGAFSKQDALQPKKKATFSDTQSLNYNKK